MEENLQVLIIFRLFRLVKTPLRCFLHIRLGIIVHDTYVMNTVSHFLSEVMDQNVDLLFCGLWHL